MRSARPEDPVGSGGITLADVDRGRLRTLRRRIRRWRRPGLLTAGAACVGTGALVHNPGMVAMPLLVAAGWVVFAVKDSAAPFRAAAPVPSGGTSVPMLEAVYEAVPSGADPRALSATATGSGGTRDAWYSGGGLALTRDGMLTASDGRKLFMAWETQPGGVSRGGVDRSRADTGPHGPAQSTQTRSGPTRSGPTRSNPTRVVEVAVVAQGSSVHAVCLRNERGEQLAALPVAGLDGRHVAALAWAAGVHYRRYRVDPATPAFSRATDVDCFPSAASFSRFRGPRDSVRLTTWVLGEQEAAAGADS